MSGGMFWQIVVLIVIGVVAATVVKCMHDKFCGACKKKDDCCK